MSMAIKLPFLHRQPTRTPSPAFEFQRSHFPYSRQNRLSISTTRINSLLGYKPLLQKKSNFFLSPLRKTSKSTPSFTIKSQINFSLISSPHDQWGTWIALFATGAFGIWLEKTKIGIASYAAVVSILVGFAASNLGIIPHESPAYLTALEFLLPLAVPLLLFRADLRRLIQSTGTLLSAFLLGSVAKTVGTILACMMIPMQSLGRDGWKIKAALMARHIGGAEKYVSTATSLGVSSSVLTATLPADSVICALYFTILFALASKLPPQSSALTTVEVDEVIEGFNCGDKLTVLQLATALAVAFAVCKTGTYLTNYWDIPGYRLTAITAIVVTLATALPTQFDKLAPAGEAMAPILLQVFLTVMGARGNVGSVINTAPSIFMFALVQLSVHLAMTLGLGKLFRFDLKVMLLASNANVGDSTAAFGMAAAKGWRSLIVPAIIAGIFGNAMGTSFGLHLFADFVLFWVNFMRGIRTYHLVFFRISYTVSCIIMKFKQICIWLK